MAYNIFLSFTRKDTELAHLFRSQAEARQSSLVFRDYLIREKFEAAWRMNAERLIRACSVIICLVGGTTHRSDAVDWEIRKSAELDKPIRNSEGLPLSSGRGIGDDVDRLKAWPRRWSPRSASARLLPHTTESARRLKGPRARCSVRLFQMGLRVGWRAEGDPSKWHRKGETRLDSFESRPGRDLRPLTSRVAIRVGREAAARAGRFFKKPPA